MTERKRVAPAGIHLSPEDAADAARLIRLLTGQVSAQAGDVDAPAQARQVDKSRHPRDLARRTQLSRKLRSSYFSPAMTGEPAYEMLLTLYVAESDADPMTTTQIVNQADVAPTTALRWLEYLVDQNLVQKASSPTDRRVVLVQLTDRARSLLDGYFTEIIEKGLAS